MVIPPVTHIVPIRVEPLDKRYLLLSPPPLDLLLAIDCFAHIVEALPVDKAANPEFVGKPLENFPFVLPRALVQVAGNACIKDPRGAGQDVNLIGIFAHSRHDPSTQCSRSSLGMTLTLVDHFTDTSFFASNILTSRST